MQHPDEQPLNTNQPDTSGVTAQPASAGTDATPPEVTIEAPKWPQIPCADGCVYGAEDPRHPGCHIAVMSIQTWLNYGQQTEQYRRIAKQQDAQLREVKADLAVMTQRCTDAETRLNNLREVRRTEKRAELEPGGIVLPGSDRFKSRKPQ